MTEPSGKIVARPLVVRACGHAQEFQHYAVDKYRAQRLAKFQRTRCAAWSRWPGGRYSRSNGPSAAGTACQPGGRRDGR
jgi:hypothetical protein